MIIALIMSMSISGSWSAAADRQEAIDLCGALLQEKGVAAPDAPEWVRQRWVLGEDYLECPARPESEAAAEYQLETFALKDGRWQPAGSVPLNRGAGAVNTDARARCLEVVGRPDLLATGRYAHYARASNSEMTCPMWAAAPGGEGMRVEIVDYTFDGEAWARRGPARIVVVDSSDITPESLLERWQTTRETDPISDTVNYHASVSAERVIQLEFGRQVRPELIIGCYANTSQVYLRFYEQYIGREEMPVTWRLDDRAPSSEYWRIDSSGNAVGRFSGRQAIPLIRQLAEAERLTVRLTPFSQSEWTMTFDLSGAEMVMQEIRQACSW